MVRNDKLDALIMLSGDVLIAKNAKLYRDTDTSSITRPKALDRRVQRKINKEHRKQEFGTFYKYGRRIAAALLIACTVSFAAIMSVEAVRTALWNTLIEFFDDYISVMYVADPPTNSFIEKIAEPDITINNLDKEVLLESDSMYWAVYRKDGVKIFTYTQNILDESETWIDNENSVVEDVQVNGYPALLIFRIDEKTYFLNWSDGIYSYELDSYSSNISKEELLTIAETIN